MTDCNQIRSIRNACVGSSGNVCSQTGGNSRTGPVLSWVASQMTVQARVSSLFFLWISWSNQVEPRGWSLWLAMCTALGTHLVYRLLSCARCGRCDVLVAVFATCISALTRCQDIHLHWWMGAVDIVDKGGIRNGRKWNRKANKMRVGMCPVFGVTRGCFGKEQSKFRHGHWFGLGECLSVLIDETLLHRSLAVWLISH